MPSKYIKKRTIGLIVFVFVLFIITPVIIGSIDWLGYRAVDTAKRKCMMAYLNLKQVVLELPVDDNELIEFVEDVCATVEGKLNIPSGGIWIWQARFWQSEDGKWFWQNYERQRTINLMLAQRLTDTAHLIDAKTASTIEEVFREKRSKQDRWDAILAEIKAASTFSGSGK
jgi:hypothetical protein